MASTTSTSGNKATTAKWAQKKRTQSMTLEGNQKVPFSDYPKLKAMYYEDRKTLAEIGAAYGVSKRCISIIFQKQGWAARSNSVSQLGDRYTKKNVAKYKAWYLAGKGGIWVTAAKFGLDPKKLIKIARTEGWYIHNYQHVMYERTEAQNTASERAKLRRLEQAAVVRPHSLPHYREKITSLTRRVVRLYGKVLAGVGDSIDHVYPVSRAYYGMDNSRRPCSMLELCHPANLCWLPRNKNCAKHSAKTTSLKATRVAIRKWNAEHGNPWKHPKLEAEATLLLGA